MGRNGTGEPFVKYILDTSAVIAFFLAEKGCDAVEKILQDPPGACCMHSVNWIELYYKMHHYGGPTTAKTAIDNLRAPGVSITDISGEDFLLQVAKIKISQPFLSLGDCYAIGLSSWLKGTVVTSDKRFTEASSFARIKIIR